MAQGLIDRTTLEAATEGVQVIGKVFLRALLREASENGWFVDITNDVNTFMRPDRDVQGMLFGPGGIGQDQYAHDVALTRLGSESYGFMNPGLTYHTDLRVRNMESTVVPHANVKAWGAVGDDSANDRGEILDALTALKNAGGGELFFPPGTYRISTGISISDLKGVTIRGSGTTSTTIRIDDIAARHFTFTAAENLAVKDITIGRTFVGGSIIEGMGGINMPKGGNSFNEGHRFENVHFEHLTDVALEIETPRGLVISNVSVDNQRYASAIDLLTPFSTSIHSLVMTSCEQRGLYLHGYGRDVSVQSSRAYNCGIGFETEQCVAVFNACTAEEGVNTSASYPGYGFVAGDTYSQVTLMNTSVVSTAGITAYVETNGAVFAKFNALQLMAGMTTTETIVPGPIQIDNELLLKAGSVPGEAEFRYTDDSGYADIHMGTLTAWSTINANVTGNKTNSPQQVFIGAAKTISTPAVGFGHRMRYDMHEENNILKVAGYCDVVWNNATAGNYSADFVWSLADGASAPSEAMRLTSAGMLTVPLVHIATAVEIGGVPSTVGAIRLENASWIYSRNAGNDDNTKLLRLDVQDRIALGDGAESSVLIVGGVLGIGAAAFIATTGALRLENDSYIYSRDQADATNHSLIGLDTSDRVVIGETGVYTVLPGTKSTSGDPTGTEGLIYINTFNNVIKMYADGAWRTITSW